MDVRGNNVYSFILGNDLSSEEETIKGCRLPTYDQVYRAFCCKKRNLTENSKLAQVKILREAAEFSCPTNICILWKRKYSNCRQGTND